VSIPLRSATSRGRSWGATRPIRSMPCIFANTLNCSSRAHGPRLRQQCGVCANSRQSGLARSPA
jgi:hypothetical protein